MEEFEKKDIEKYANILKHVRKGQESEGASYRLNYAIKVKYFSTIEKLCPFKV